ncbi:beta-lactamase-like domain protein [Mycobacterium ulcerans str. Harvey]|uniref:Beta-lactamase-like domain protein n=1 Tax=Mycobacterium ulcerans str. Harvey TaxID=1299332 RepID=A0ABP3AHI8_MYCUL|nr:beta-lactamase-like domain protein [Mycobacterium ulcerans str. Harvey]
MLVTDETGVMLIDAGYPGDRNNVLTSLRTLGYGPATYARSC